MPIDIRVDTAKRMIVETLTGRVTGDEIAEAWKTVSDNHDFDSGYWQFSDFAQVTDFDVSATFFRNFASSGALFDRSSRRALFAPSNEVFGMLRLYFAHLGDRSGEIRLFRDRAQALNWLGLEGIAD